MGSLFKLIDVLQKDLHVPQVSNLLEQCFIYFLFTFALNTLQSPCICVLFLVKSWKLQSSQQIINDLEHPKSL